MPSLAGSSCQVNVANGSHGLRAGPPQDLLEAQVPPSRWWQHACRKLTRAFCPEEVPAQAQVLVLGVRERRQGGCSSVGSTVVIKVSF